ncbi:hypothetical protein E2C01_019081 [Portunus trituberculatus]|uniref:Uncharacterized protein n=1 Tax=Portunus trituberculatus TaxID=210409 RepID=A0A5B7DWY7_PORTR|nr:hypothetical protein [Portunus trituberculatus]
MQCPRGDAALRCVSALLEGMKTHCLAALPSRRGIDRRHGGKCEPARPTTLITTTTTTTHGISSEQPSFSYRCPSM